ncbi:GNAT family N-acetyltransferase [Caproicibacterium lactatifermentans]|nr:GNAT family N-acetyltransferase [Caproicibacterium lactatifermentans]
MQSALRAGTCIMRAAFMAALFAVCLFFSVGSLIIKINSAEKACLQKAGKGMEHCGNIRPAAADDAARLAEIYAPYAEETVITFEEQAPNAAEMARRVQQTQREYPWLVYEEDGHVQGYAYAHQLQSRASFRWSAEVSIYISWLQRGRGIGRALYEQLENRLQKMGCIQLYAQIAVPNPESVGFHHACGYEDIYLYPHVAYKLGKWCDLAVLTKQLQLLPEHPADLTDWRP